MLAAISNQYVLFRIGLNLVIAQEAHGLSVVLRYVSLPAAKAKSSNTMVCLLLTRMC